MLSFIDSLQLKPEQHQSLIAIEPEPCAPERMTDRFMRGPIPAEWLEQAARLPGKALHAAVAIRYLDGFERRGMIRLRPSVRNNYGMDRFSCARALGQLEMAGLIRVTRKPGAAPIVKILLKQS